MKRRNGLISGHGFCWTDVGRDPAERGRYIQAIERALPMMARLPRNAEEQYQFFSWLQVKDVMPGSKRFFRKVVTALLQCQQEIAAQLICIEVHANGVRRFNLDTILGWLDKLAASYREDVIHVVTVLDALRKRNIAVQEGKIFEYCDALCRVRQHRAAGNLLINQKLYLDSSVLTDGTVYRWTEESARDEDHGIFRMWPILLSRVRRRRYVKVGMIRALAGILRIACTERHGADFAIKTLIKMARESLRPEAYRRLLQEYRRILRESYRTDIRKMRERLRME